MVTTPRGGQDEAVIGVRTVFVLRVVLMATAIVFCGIGAAGSFGADVRPPARVWFAPGVAAFVALLICRAPERRAPDFGWMVYLSSSLSALTSGAGLLAAPDPGFGVMFVLGLVTMSLLYAWRDGKAR